MRVVVTGAAGFIGSHLAETLHAAGHEVVAVDDLSFGKAENLPQEIPLHVADAASPEALYPLLEGADALLHLAACASVPFGTAHPVEAHRSTGLSTLVAMEGARRFGIARSIVTSSAAVYGERGGVQREDGPTDPQSFYAQDKAYSEMVARNYARTFGLKTLAIRPFNVYGPRQSAAGPYGAVIPLWIQALLQGAPVTVFGDGRQTRDFTYVSDIVNGMMAALRADPVKLDGRAVNLARGEGVSLLDLFDVMKRLLGRGCEVEVRFMPERPGDIRRSTGDITLARELLGYEPKVGLEEGLKETADWIRWEMLS